MPLRRNNLLKWLKWPTAFAAALLGILGYVQPLTESSWPRWSSVVLMAAFCLITGGQWILDHLKERAASEEFYDQEITEVFPPSSASRMRFFKDKADNMCVALILEHEPIPQSVNLWEGGYHAPPITLVVEGRTVVFRHSGYEKAEDYTTASPVYQVRYFPRQS